MYNQQPYQPTTVTMDVREYDRLNLRSMNEREEYKKLKSERDRYKKRVKLADLLFSFLGEQLSQFEPEELQTMELLKEIEKDIDSSSDSQLWMEIILKRLSEDTMNLEQTKKAVRKMQYDSLGRPI
ncbi:hypothetical protein ACI2JA_19675 [Alkalihalobacillus sp. NPDC078783]|uniref:hypothetical protein n=1 Tax=Streptomyces albidoflavus TaxID=1886 RepID=UPI0033C4A036